MDKNQEAKQKLIDGMKSQGESIVQSLQRLKDSYEPCKGLGIQESYSKEELEQLKKLMDTFASHVHLVTNDFLKTLCQFFDMKAPLFEERAALAVKEGVAENVKAWQALYRLHNLIVDKKRGTLDPTVIVQQLLDYTATLLLVSEETLAYIKTKFA